MSPFALASNSGLLQTKLRDFRIVVILQILLIFIALVVKDILTHAGLPPASALSITKGLFLTAGGIYLFMLWDMMRNFTSSKLVLRTTLFLLVFGYFFGALFTNPFVEILGHSNPYRKGILLTVQLAIFTAQVIFIYFSCRNLFNRDEPIEHKLWGAACVYIMIGITFGSAYGIIHILDSDSLGVAHKVGLNSYMEGIYYSMNTLGGLDTAYPNAIKVIRNLGVIESVWSHLFIVILVGRILLRYGMLSQANNMDNPGDETADKDNPFFNVLWVQVILIGGFMVFNRVLNILDMKVINQIMRGGVMFFGALYILSMEALLEKLRASMFVRRAIWGLLIASVLIVLILFLSDNGLMWAPPERSFLIFMHTCLLVIQIIVLGYTLPNVFSGRRVNQTKLYGTACVYLMIGLAFGNAYELMNLLVPGCFGVDLGTGYASYSECLYYSMYSLAGLDTDYPEAFRLVRNTGVIEAVWSELFIALLVGNLLNKPE